METGNMIDGIMKMRSKKDKKRKSIKEKIKEMGFCDRVYKKGRKIK